MKAVLHIHTRHSSDCLTPPWKTVDWAIQNGIAAICITDHDKVEGSLEAAAYARKKYGEQLQVIPGAEFSSDWGDLIGINIRQNIRSRDPLEIMRRVREAGGLVLLPHPFANHKNTEWLARESDAIEVFNARASALQNRQALELAEKLGKPTFAGSDAHALSELGLCINHFKTEQSDFLKALLSAERKFETRQAAPAQVHRSQFVKGLKTGNWRLAAASGRRWILARG